MCGFGTELTRAFPPPDVIQSRSLSAADVTDSVSAIAGCNGLCMPSPDVTDSVSAIPGCNGLYMPSPDVTDCMPSTDVTDGCN